MKTLLHQILASVVAAILTVAAPLAGAQVAPSVKDVGGFYGGVSQRNAGTDASGLTVGHLSSTWSKFALPVADDSGARTLAFGGYRWGNDVAVEAALASVDQLALMPLAGSARGVGLSLAGVNDIGSRAYNADVYTTWEFRKSFSLYGRLGYAVTEAAPSYLVNSGVDARRNRDGVNYGVGLRYDMTRALGLRLEYARFGRNLSEPSTGVLPENDQLQFGVQFRF